MLPKRQVQVSFFCLAAIVLLIFVEVVWVFYVPKILYNYEKTGVELSPALRLLIKIAHIFPNSELITIPALFLSFFLALIWFIYSLIKLHQFKKNSQNAINRTN